MYAYCKPVIGYLLIGDGRCTKGVVGNKTCNLPVHIIVIGLCEAGLSNNFLPQLIRQPWTKLGVHIPGPVFNVIHLNGFYLWGYGYIFEFIDTTTGEYGYKNQKQKAKR